MWQDSLIAAQSFNTVPEHARFNELLMQAMGVELFLRELSDRAYAVAELESSPGPRNELLRLARAADEFADLASRIKPL